MAQAGKLLPFALRQQIKQERAEKTVRAVAKELQLSKTTVCKYSRNNLGTKPFQRHD